MKYLYLVEVLYHANFEELITRKITKSKRAAENWGEVKIQELAERDYSNGVDIIDYYYGYHVYMIEYLEN